MKYVLLMIISGAVLLATTERKPQNDYQERYRNRLVQLEQAQQRLTELIQQSNTADTAQLQHIRRELHHCRLQLKSVDFWLRYLEPVVYKQINGPLPVEWETEVFEKFEPPYRRAGAGLTLAEELLEEDPQNKDSLLELIHRSRSALATFRADSITKHLTTPDAFFFCNRLFLLNLASIYTTGFECPAPERIIPELKWMLAQVEELYHAYNNSFPSQPLPEAYLQQYDNAVAFVQQQSDDYTRFPHFQFIREYVNPLFARNKELILQYKAVSRSYNDYTLSTTTSNLFDKSLFFAQYEKGVYYRSNNSSFLKELDSIGKLLFYDPILSVNNERSCASCHKPTEYFTDNNVATALQLNGTDRLPRNTPTLLNVPYQHLLHLDGKHLSLQDQAVGVITNPIEMGSNKKDVLEKILNCPDYKSAFQRFLKQLPGETNITLEQIVSAITFYYSKFSHYTSPFDQVFLSNKSVSREVEDGFNLFMSKAQCATCHFVPTFSGIKPPFIGNEFEVIGTPADSAAKHLSKDEGRYSIHPTAEMRHAFRTGSLRNSGYTAPYMHNGVYRTLEEVIDFYDAGGGTGKGLEVPNQTLAGDSLHLTAVEKKSLLAFLHSLNETIVLEAPPRRLPLSRNRQLNNRKVGGTY
jgi:cytochrome c peroxidase